MILIRWLVTLVGWFSCVTTALRMLLNTRQWLTNLFGVVTLLAQDSWTSAGSQNVSQKGKKGHRTAAEGKNMVVSLGAGILRIAAECVVDNDNKSERTRYLSELTHSHKICVPSQNSG